MENIAEVVSSSGAMPTPMAVASRLTTNNRTDVAKKTLDDFRRELPSITAQFWRSTKLMADFFVEARLALSPEDFQQLISEAQISYSWLCKLMNQATDYRLNDPKNADLLPDVFSTRYEIMLMKESTFRLGVTKGIIHKNCTLADVKNLREQVEGKKGKGKTASDGEGEKTSSPSSQPANASLSNEPAAVPSSSAGEEVRQTDKTEPAGSVSTVVASLQPTTTKAKQASVKAPGGKPAPLKLVSDRSADGAPRVDRNRIAVLLTPDAAKNNADQLQALRSDLAKLVAKYSFIESIDFPEVA